MRGSFQPVAWIWNSDIGRGIVAVIASFLASAAVHLALTADPHWAWSTRNALLVTLIFSVALRRSKKGDDGR